MKKVITKKIVIDLRKNYGGLIGYAKEYLFPALYKEKVEFSFQWSVPKSEGNRYITKDIVTCIKYNRRLKENKYFYSYKDTFVGKESENKNVYYLVGPSTGSAADEYIAMIKENGLGTIVGENTGGEGLGDSFVCNRLSNSSLVYVYYPSDSDSADGKSNSVYGTEPHIYINQTLEDYKKQQEFVKKEMENEYSSKVEYDAVLKWVLKN